MTTALLYYGHDKYKQMQQAILSGKCPSCVYGTIPNGSNGHTQECIKSWDDYRNKLKTESTCNDNS